MAKTLYNDLHALSNKSPGSLILMDMSFEPSTYPDCGYALEAIIKDLHTMTLKVVVVATMAQGVFQWQRALTAAGGPGKWQYGVDYVNIGYIGMSESGMASLGQNPKFKVTDFAGTNLNNLPIMNEFRSPADIKMVIIFALWGEGPDGWVRQWATPYGTPLYFVATGLLAPAIMAYYPGRAKAVLFGLRGGGEYEQLAKVPGAASAQLDAVSTTHITMIVLVIIGNIAYFIIRRRK
jgi:hypothetical protein